jgi:hypothetical protein
MVYACQPQFSAATESLQPSSSGRPLRLLMHPIRLDQNGLVREPSLKRYLGPLKIKEVSVTLQGKIGTNSNATSLVPRQRYTPKSV